MTSVVTPLLSIQTILSEWGKGRAIGRAPNGFPSQSAHDRMRRIPGRGTVSACGLDEESFDMVDMAVSELRTKGDHRHAVLAYYYVEGWDYKRIGYEIKEMRGDKARPIGKHRARDTKIAAEAWVSGKLDDMGMEFCK